MLSILHYSIQSLSCVQLFATPWTAACQDSLSFTISQILLILMSIESVMPSTISSSVVPFSSHLQSFPVSGSFLNELALRISWPKYWSFSFSISPSSEYSGLISFRTDWFDLAVQGALKSLLQHHSSKASILWHSAFFMVQLSHPYTTIYALQLSRPYTFDYMDLCWWDDVSACWVPAIGWHHLHLYRNGGEAWVVLSEYA